MIRSHHRRAGLLALGIFATAASAAHAATYEQLSRGAGKTGTSSLATSVPLAASDTGLGGAYRRFDSVGVLPPVTNDFVRNTLLSTTTPLRSSGTSLAAVDRTERIGLFASINFTTFQFELAVGPLYGTGATRPVGSVSIASRGSFAMSGDGRTVVISDAAGTRSVNVATGAVTQLTTQYVGLSKSSVSDDGSVIAGATFSDDFSQDPSGGVILRGGHLTVLAGNGSAVSPDGSTVTSIETTPHEGAPSTNTLVSRTVATAAERRTVVPAAIGTDPRLIWVSSTGDRAAVGPGYNTASAQVLSRSTGRWSAFGAQVSQAFTGQDLIAGGVDEPAAISRNGNFAAMAYNAQVSLESLTGASLVGGGDTLSAFSYLASQGVSTCGYGGAPASFDGHLATVPAWLPSARKGTLTVSADGAVLKTVTTTTATAYAGPDDAAFHVDFPAGAHSSVVKFTVVDQLGRTATESVTTSLDCPAGS